MQPWVDFPASNRIVYPMKLGTFSDAVINADLPVPAGIIGPQGKKAAKRFDVYRNNVIVGLVGSLVDIFPSVHNLVGDEFFRAMAAVYARQEPPTSPLLFEYGGGFPAFLEQFEPVQKLIYLPDVARFELIWLQAYHAADVPVLNPDALAAIAPENLAETRFIPHPAAHVVRSGYASVSILSASRSGGDLSSIDPMVGEDGLISRSNYDVEIRNLPPGAAVFLAQLMDGETLGAAAGAAMGEAENFDIAAAITAMLEAGAFSDLHTNDDNGRGSTS